MTNPRIDELRRRLEKEPQSRLFAQLAEELRKDGDLNGAIRVAREGLEKHPGYVSARMTLGRALQDSGEIAGARVEFEAVLSSAPDNILASRLLAGCLEGLGSIEAALARYRSTLALSPGDPQLMARVTALEQRMGGASLGTHAVPPPAPVSVPPAVIEPPPPPAFTQQDWEAPLFEGGEPSAEIIPEVEPMAEVTDPVDEAPLPVAILDEAENFELEGAFEAPGMTWQDPEPVAAPEAAELASSTIGEIYFNQGHTGKAIEVYRRVVEQDPGNERARARLAELEAIERHLRADEAAAARAALAMDPRAARRAALERTIGRLEDLMGSFKNGRP